MKSNAAIISEESTEAQNKQIRKNIEILVDNCIDI